MSLQVYQIPEFESVLDDAERNARTESEMEFVAKMRERHDIYGQQTYVSEAQWRWLQDIADR